MRWDCEPYPCASRGRSWGKAQGGKGKWKGSYGAWDAKGPRRPPRRGEFPWTCAAALEAEPEVLPRASYSYASKSPEMVDVLCPAWSVRRLRQSPGDEWPAVDLSLWRGLEELQDPDGGFELTSNFVALIGLEEPNCALALAEDPHARAFGAVLALKAVQVYVEGHPAPALAEICRRAEEAACMGLGLESDVLNKALGAPCGASVRPGGRSGGGPLPTAVCEVLQANFAPSGRWSFFELWARLLPPETAHGLREEGGLLCPRFFLVDLACAPLSPYEVSKVFPLVRQGACVFVGQPGDDIGGARDAMRQGRQLEAALLSFGWLEEDHVLTELRLPGARAIYSAAPDAIEADNLSDQADGPGTEAEPFPPGDDASYEAAGYHLEEVFPAASAQHERCRLWRAEWAPTPPEAYVEVKKTTHLNGRPGQFKILKFWLQAALMRCGAVVVATTDGSVDGDVAVKVQRLPTRELEKRVEGRRVWGILDSMLRLVLEDTAVMEGPWTLRLHKARGPDAVVSLSLHTGWAEAYGQGPAHVVDRVSSFFEALPEDGNSHGGADDAEDQLAVGQPVEGYWPDDDTWLPAQVHALRSDGFATIIWDDDGSSSLVPRDYVRALSA